MPKSRPEMTDGERAFRALIPADQELARLLSTGKMTGTDAWPRSSPSRKATGASASELVHRKLKDVDFAAALAWLKEQAADAVVLDVRQWWRSATEIHNFDPRKLKQLARGTLDPEDLTEAEAAAISGWSEKFDPLTGVCVHRAIKTTPRVDILRLTQAPLGITTERVELTPAQADEIIRGATGEK